MGNAHGMHIIRFTMQYACQCKWGLQPAKTLVPQRFAGFGLGTKLAWRGVVFYERPGESFSGGEGPPEFSIMYTSQNFSIVYTCDEFLVLPSVLCVHFTHPIEPFQ